MPRSLTRFILLIGAMSLVLSCGGPPKKPTPPDKATDMVVAKDTTTTDLPEGQPVQPIVPDSPVRPGVEPARYPEARPVMPAPAGGPVEPAKYPGTAPVAETPAAPGPVEPAKYPGETAPAAPQPTRPAPQPAAVPDRPAPMPGGPVADRPMTIDEYIERMMRARVQGDGMAVPPPVQPQPVPPQPVPQPVPPQPVPQPVPPQPVPPQPVPPAPMSAEDRIMEELAERKKIELQFQEYLVNYYLEQTKTAMDDLRWEDAQKWVLKALERAPDNQEAIGLYHEILAAQGLRAGEVAHGQNALEDLHNVRIQDAKTKANYYFNRGKKAYHEEMYDEAIEAFEDVQTIINRAPYGADWGTLPEDTEELLAQARLKKKLKDEELARDAAQRAYDVVKQDELKRKMEAEEKIEKLLSEGLDAFENERFEIAETLADQVLAMDPNNARARELLEQSVRARHRRVSDDLLRVTKERFREWKLDIQKSSVPWSTRPLEWPNQEEWDRITRRAAAISDFGAGTTLDPQDQSLKNQLREELVTFSFDNATLPEALDFIRTLKSINIVIDDNVKDDLEGAPVTLTVNDLELESALDLLLRLAGPEYTYILKQGVVYITDQSGARGQAVLRVHSVGDLTIQLTNFIAPNLILKPAGAEIDESAPLFGKDEEGEKLIGGGAEDLMDLITQNIQPETWEEGDDYSINVSGEDKLVVVHTPEVQAEVARFLDDLRRFAGLVVTIETRFLTVNDDFLQDIGVDIRGLGGEKGTLVNLDDVTSGLEDNASAGFDNSGPGQPVASGTNPSAGVFFNQNSDGDYRGRNENVFDRALGQVLSPLGGAVIQYTFLDDTSVGLIMQAVEKSRHARFLQAPSLTVYNTQRANITVVNQLSFIQDFDVEVAQTAFIADPIVGIIQDGLALDVRPTISHDRKYVTLELQPTIATLLRPIPTFQTSLGALTTPVTIQIPELIIQKSQTTVRVPDGGSLVIGGLKNISLVDMQSEVPFLAKIPLLNFFFSRKGSSREVENLMVIVTARITDLVEEEIRFRQPYVR